MTHLRCGLGLRPEGFSEVRLFAAPPATPFGTSLRRKAAGGPRPCDNGPDTHVPWTISLRAYRHGPCSSRKAPALDRTSRTHSPLAPHVRRDASFLPEEAPPRRRGVRARPPRRPGRLGHRPNACLLRCARAPSALTGWFERPARDPECALWYIQRRRYVIYVTSGEGKRSAG